MDLRVLGYVLVVEFHNVFNLVLNLVDMGESQFLEAGVDFPGLELFLELANESGRYKAYPIFIVMYQGKVVLLDIDGLVRTYFHTVSAVHAFVVVHLRFAATYADGPGRARAHTGGAAQASVLVNLE